MSCEIGSCHLGTGTATSGREILEDTFCFRLMTSVIQTGAVVLEQTEIFNIFAHSVSVVGTTQ